MKPKQVHFCLMGMLIAGLASVAQAQVFSANTAPLARFGPVDHTNGYPIWAQAASTEPGVPGTMLELCFDTNTVPDVVGGGAACPTCIDPALDLPNPAAPLSFPDNFPQEAFYFLSTSLMDTNGGGRTRLDLALEGAFDGLGTVQPGEQIVFSRIRIRVDNATGGKRYKITHPFGVVEVRANGQGPRGINLSNDIFLWKGSLGGNLLNPLQSNFGTFLSAAGGAVSPGYIGDFCNVNTVTGSPFGTNVFRIEGPNIGEPGSKFLCADPTLGPDPVAVTDCIETYDFSLLGKSPSRFGAGIDRATYTRDANATQIDVWGNSIPGASLEVGGSGIPVTPMIEDINNPGRYYAHIVISSGYLPPADWTVTVTNIADGISSSAVLRDQVMFLGAATSGTVASNPTFDLSAVDAAGMPSPTLSIAATSTNADAAASLSTSTGVALGSTGSMDISGVNVPPMSVTIVSPFGGIMEMPVQVLSTVTGPLAFAGNEQIVQLGSPVTLDGTGSHGNITSYSWAEVPTSSVVLTGAATATPNFTFPTTDALLTFQLTVTDSLGMTNKSLVTVTNTATANAGGPTLALTTFPTAPVQLNGSASGVNVTFSWTQVTGQPVALSDPTLPNPTFVFPVEGAGFAGALPPNDQPITLVLTVTGPGGTAMSPIVITGPPGAPIANAGLDKTVLVDDVVQLDGSGMGLITGYSWTQMSGNAAPLGVLQPGGIIDFTGNLNIPNPVFVFPNIPQTVTFQLVVTGPGGVSAPSTVNITAGSPFTPDTLAIDPKKAQYNTAKSAWNLEGTSSMVGPGHFVTIYLGPPLPQNAIGVGAVDAGGKFKVQCNANCPDPTAGPQPTLTVISTLGGILEGAGYTIK